MKLRHLNALLFAGALSFSLISCKSGTSDADIQTEVTKKLSDEGGANLTSSVSNGVVTLSGSCKDEECRRSCADEVKDIKGVKNVVNNITVAAAVEITLWPLVYSGKGGVCKTGRHFSLIYELI